MSNLKFRELRPEEIEVRAAQCYEHKARLLLYKDARCDMNILDETVGPLNWQRHHSRENANCIVSVWDDEKQQWIEKEDTGTESNTEAAKGLCSDSFKRCCVNFGIGRSLYSAPVIEIRVECTKKPNSNKYQLPYGMEISVSKYVVEEGRIVELELVDQNNKSLFYWTKKKAAAPVSKVDYSVMSTGVAPAPQKPKSKPMVLPDVFGGSDGSDLVMDLDAPGVDIEAETKEDNTEDNEVTIAKAEFGETKNGTKFIRIVYDYEHKAGDLEEFHLLSNSYGVKEALKTLTDLTIIPEEVLNGFRRGKKESAAEAVKILNNDKKQHFYNVEVKNNSRGYKVFDISLLR